MSTFDDRGATNHQRILVSGITGHVGRILARQLLSAGADVHGLTRQAPSDLAAWPTQVTLHRIGHNTATLVSLFQDLRPDILIHLAALARRDHLTSDVAPFIESNVLYGAQLLEGMRLSGCKQVVTAESVLQYSDAGQKRPLNLYAATKHAFADLLLYFADAFEMSAIALVLPTIYSEHETLPKLMTDIATAVKGGTVLNLQAEDVRIDLVHVDDVASAFVQAQTLLKNDATQIGPGLRRYWVSSGNEVSPQELLALFERIAETRVVVRKAPRSGVPRRLKPWRGPVVPGWIPQIDLEIGIRRMLAM